MPKQHKTLAEQANTYIGINFIGKNWLGDLDSNQG